MRPSIVVYTDEDEDGVKGWDGGWMVKKEEEKRREEKNTAESYMSEVAQLALSVMFQGTNGSSRALIGRNPGKQSSFSFVFVCVCLVAPQTDCSRSDRAERTSESSFCRDFLRASLTDTFASLQPQQEEQEGRIWVRGRGREGNKNEDESKMVIRALTAAPLIPLPPTP